MSTLFPKPITLERGTGTYVNGEWVKSQPALTEVFMGSVQPANGKDITALPQARLDKGHCKVFSSIPLKVSTEGQPESGDVVQWQGQRWEIISQGRYQNDLLNHYEYIAEYIGEVSP